MFHRAPGSIGASAFPSRVLKGMRAAGHMGADRVTVKNLEVVRVDAGSNILVVRGSVPAGGGGYLVIRKRLGTWPRRRPKTPRRQRRPRAAVQAEGQPRLTRRRGERPRSGTPMYDVENERVETSCFSPVVFGVKVNEHLLYEAVKQYRAGARRGTHMTKNRALVSGSGRKPWRQKGTGRARVGEIRTPLWRHGGTVFGPMPRDYSYGMPKKARAAALRSALTQRVREGASRSSTASPSTRRRRRS